MCTFSSALWRTCFLFRSILEFPSVYYKTAGTFTLDLYSAITLTKSKWLHFIASFNNWPQYTAEKGTKKLPRPNRSPGRLYSGICNAIPWSQQVIAPTRPAAAAKQHFVFNKPQSHSYSLTSSVSKVLTAPENQDWELHHKDGTRKKQIDLYDI